mgnify:FL=1
MTTTNTTEETTMDLGKLQTQAHELRSAMVEALGIADDGKVRKLSNELASVNKQILDIEVNAQGDARATFLEAMHDTLNEFEIGGMELTVKFDAHNGVTSIAYGLTGAMFDKIKAAVALVERPSSATKWVYTWEDGDDGSRHQSFEFGKAGTKRSPGSSNGTRTVGWLSKDGTEMSLGDAYELVATDKNKADLAKLTGGSATHAHKSKVVSAAGFTKK